jgi:hypothetical protein
MKVLTPTVHGILDYAVVLVFLAAPTAVGLAGISAVLSYTLAGVHLTLTLLTVFPLGAVKVIPFKVHGWIELAVGPTLVAVPWILRFAHEPLARGFYVVAGIVIFITRLITDYRAS